MAKLAIRGGRPVARKPPLCPWPIADAGDGRVLLQALMNPAGGCRLGVKGGQAERFERKFARYHDAAHCLAVANGTVAIETILKAGGLKAGDFAFTSIGQNYRLSELAAAVLCTQLEKFPGQARTRARNAARIARGIADIPGLLPLRRDERITRRGYYFWLRQLPQCRTRRLQRAGDVRAARAALFGRVRAGGRDHLETLGESR